MRWESRPDGPRRPKKYLPDLLDPTNQSNQPAESLSTRDHVSWLSVSTAWVWNRGIHRVSWLAGWLARVLDVAAVRDWTGLVCYFGYHLISWILYQRCRDNPWFRLTLDRFVTTLYSAFGKFWPTVDFTKKGNFYTIQSLLFGGAGEGERKDLRKRKSKIRGAFLSL